MSGIGVSSTTEAAFFIAATSLCWGVTNALLRRGSLHVVVPPFREKSSSAIVRFLKRCWLTGRCYLSNYRVLAPLAVNQAGSLLFLGALRRARLSIVVPTSNSLTFLITLLTGRWLGESQFNRLDYLGFALVIGGIAICVVSSAQ